MNREQAVVELIYIYETWGDVEDSVTEVETVPGWIYCYGKVINDDGNWLPITESDFNEAKYIKTQLTKANIEEESKLTHKDRDAIDHIMDNFNFKRVDEVMRHLSWKWTLNDMNHDDTGTPLETSLREKARDALVRCKCSRAGHIYGGGFKAIYDKDDKYFNLEFVLCDWDSEVESEVTD